MQLYSVLEIVLIYAFIGGEWGRLISSRYWRSTRCQGLNLRFYKENICSSLLCSLHSSGNLFYNYPKNIAFCFLLLGSHPGVLRTYSWLCTQGVSLTGLWRPYVMPEIELAWSCARQMFSPTPEIDSFKVGTKEIDIPWITQ